MICPYSHYLCRECSVFRARHYYLCFCRDYRGYLGDNQDEKAPPESTLLKETESKKDNELK